MRRVMFAGSCDWSNFFSVEQVIQEELADGPFIAVHQGREDYHPVFGNVVELNGLGRRVELWVGCVDLLVQKYVDKLSAGGAEVRCEVEPFSSDVERVRVFPTLGDAGTIEIMARAMAAGIPVINHGYSPASTEARRKARGLV